MDCAVYPEIPKRFHNREGFDEYIGISIDVLESLHSKGRYSAEALRLNELVFNVFSIKRDWDLCIEYCELWLSRIPPIPDDYIGGPYLPTVYYSKALMKKGDFTTAEGFAKRAIDLSRRISDNPLGLTKQNSLVQAVCYYGTILAKQGRYDEAVNEIQSIKDEVAGAENYGQLFFVLAGIHRKREMLNQALDFVDEAIAHLASVDKLPKLRDRACKLKVTILEELDGRAVLDDTSPGESQLEGDEDYI